MALAAPLPPRSAPSAETPGGSAAPTPRAPRVVLCALLVCAGYAAFAGGAETLPRETVLQIALLVVAGAACATWLYGSARAPSSTRLGWAGIAFVVLLAAWAGVSGWWTVAPDRSWAEVNRALAYAVAAGLGIAVGSSLPRAPARACAGLTLLGGVVALYAVGAKTVPGLSLDGLLDLDQAGRLSRLRAPLAEPDALGALCALTALPALATACDPERRSAARLLALCGLAVLLVCLGLATSRGAVVALLAGLAILLWLGRERLRPLAHLGLAMLAAAGPLAVALSRSDLNRDGLPLGRRDDDAALVGLALLVALALLAAAGRVLLALERRGAFTPRRDRVASQLLAVAAVVAVVGGLFAAAISDRGMDGTATDAADRFTSTPTRVATDPARALSLRSGDRWGWWQEAAGAWSDQPLKGWGAGSFPVTHLLYRRDALETTRPESTPLGWLAGLGVVGLVLGAAGVLALLVAAGVGARRAEADDDVGARAALVAVGAAWAVHALVSSDWDVPGVTLPAMVALGVAAARRGTPPTTPGAGVGRGVAYAAVLCLLLAAAVSSALPGLAASRTAAAREQADAAAGDPERLAAAASRAELAARLNPTAVDALLVNATIAAALGDLGQARRQVARAIERQPESAEAWRRLVEVDVALDDRVRLPAEVERMMALDPRGPAALDLAARAQASLTPPQDSPTATGSPLPEIVPLPGPAAGADPSAPALPDAVPGD